jgi:hypothetical protein
MTKGGTWCVVREGVFSRATQHAPSNEILREYAQDDLSGIGHWDLVICWSLGFGHWSLPAMPYMYQILCVVGWAWTVVFGTFLIIQLKRKTATRGFDVVTKHHENHL